VSAHPPLQTLVVWMTTAIGRLPDLLLILLGAGLAGWLLSGPAAGLGS
jgi:hypothetical protein